MEQREDLNPTDIAISLIEEAAKKEKELKDKGRELALTLKIPKTVPMSEASDQDLLEEFYRHLQDCKYKYSYELRQEWKDKQYVLLTELLAERGFSTQSLITGLFEIRTKR